ncbi:MAG: hypothetical protein JW759_09665 [Candidatus Coatesbacteria bacterium]|nr:hypothetical protein [Candidatus Coatesbacteria bacterium]
MTLPDSAKPRNKRLSFYKFVVDNLSDEAPVIVEGCSDLFGGWVEPRAVDSLSNWVELLVDSFSGGLNSKMRVRFVVNVRQNRDDDSFQMKRMDELLEAILSLLNLSAGGVIPVYDFSDPANPERIGEEQGLGFIPRHTPEKDGFKDDEVGVKRYELHYELWLWQEGVAA